MRYEILSDDLLDRKNQRRGPQPNRPRRKLFGPMFIHIFLVFLLIIFLIIYFSQDSGVLENQTGEIILIGDVNKFNETYKGNLTFTSTDFHLEKNKLKIEEGSTNFEIIDFDGNIYLQNESIIFQGMAKEIINGKNKIEVNNEQFILESYKKTNLKIFFEKLFLSFEKGKIKIDESLNFEFKNTSITLQNYNATISYDKEFSFSGNSQNFTIESYQDDLKIIYKKQEKKNEKK